MKKNLAKILLDQKYIANFALLEDSKQGIIRVNLKYKEGKSVITGLRRISKPGIRTYRRATEMPRVFGGLGIAIVSTSRGVMTGTQAKKENIGGEVLAYVW